MPRARCIYATIYNFFTWHDSSRDVVKRSNGFFIIPEVKRSTRLSTSFWSHFMRFKVASLWVLTRSSYRLDISFTDLVMAARSWFSRNQRSTALSFSSQLGLL